MPKPPTLEQFKAYQAAYDYFNKALFGGELKPCLLNFRADTSGRWAFSGQSGGAETTAK